MTIILFVTLIKLKITLYFHFLAVCRMPVNLNGMLKHKKNKKTLNSKKIIRRQLKRKQFFFKNKHFLLIVRDTFFFKNLLTDIMFFKIKIHLKKRPSLIVKK